MANTFKFGNGNWAVKDGYALAYNDENNNFKPLPFDFTRASSATRVNKQGLIETVPSGKPRIDFTDNTDGHLLLEPSRTNQFTYSESLNSGWVTGGATMTLTASQFVSPDGSQNASRLQIPSSGSASVFAQLESHSSGTQYTISMYAKSNTGTNQSFRLYGDYGASGNISSDFTATNEWQRFTYTFTASASGSRGTGIYNTLNEAADLQIYGIQFESGSYATSYIPTEGSSVTRVAETANGAGNSTVFNDGEGVLYAEFSGVSSDLSSKRITLNDGSSSNRVSIGIHSVSSQLFYFVSGGGSVPFTQAITISNTEQFNKIAIKYKSGDTALWVNGVEVDTKTNTFTISGLNELALTDGGGSNVFYGKVKDLKVYNTALTDTELQNLTS